MNMFLIGSLSPVWDHIIGTYLSSSLPPLQCLLSNLTLSSDYSILKASNLHLIIQSIGILLRYFQLIKEKGPSIELQDKRQIFHLDVEVDSTNKTFKHYLFASCFTYSMIWFLLQTV